jgi:hypothetical protein
MGMCSNQEFPQGHALGSANGENVARECTYGLLPLTLLILLHPKPSYTNIIMVRLNMCSTSKDAPRRGESILTIRFEFRLV